MAHATVTETLLIALASAAVGRVKMLASCARGGGRRPGGPTPEPVLSDGESLSPGKSDDVRVTLRDATGNATACDVSLKQLRRALQSFDGQARVGGEPRPRNLENIHPRPAHRKKGQGALGDEGLPARLSGGRGSG